MTIEWSLRGSVVIRAAYISSCVRAGAIILRCLEFVGFLGFGKLNLHVSMHNSLIYIFFIVIYISKS